MSEQKVKQKQNDVIDLGVLFWNFLRSLRIFWWMVPLFTLVCMLCGIWISTSRYVPMYRSQASFTVLTGDGDSGSNSSSYGFYYDRTTAGQLAKTFPYILSSNLLTDAIKDELGQESIGASLSATAISNSNLITMTAVGTDPAKAQAALEAAITVYPDVARFVLGNLRFNMIELPTLPTEPYNSLVYKDRAVKYGMMGAAAALALIFLIAFLRKTIQKPEELKNTMNLENLGSLPEIRQKARGKKRDDVSILDQDMFTGFKENMASIYVRIEREMKQRENCKVLLVTSTAAGEGKSTFALNLAFTGARMGKSVFYVDADFRKQTTYKTLTGKNGYDIWERLEGDYQLKDMIVKHGESGIYLMQSSVPSKTPQRLIDNDKLRKVIQLMKQKTDLVIIDAPPCSLFEDAMVLAKQADAAVTVLRHDYVEKRRFTRTVADLEDTGCAMLGFVFNRVPVHRSRSGYYGYGYGRYGYGYYGYGAYGYGAYVENKKHRRERSEKTEDLSED